MYTIVCKEIERNYANAGQHYEQMLAYTLTGELRKHDSVPYDMGSDIPEYHMSVKSSHATLVSANRMVATTFIGQLDEYFNNVASKQFAYVAENNIAYVMTAVEFRKFLETFGKFEKESSKNGGKYKIRLARENIHMLNFLLQMA